MKGAKAPQLGELIENAEVTMGQRQSQSHRLRWFGHVEHKDDAN